MNSKALRAQIESVMVDLDNAASSTTQRAGHVDAYWLRERRDKLQQAIAALAQSVEAQWLPISSAPKDAPTHSIALLVFHPRLGIRRGGYTRFSADKGERPWYAEGFSGMANDEITHWMPLPAPPQLGDAV